MRSYLKLFTLAILSFVCTGIYAEEVAKAPSAISTTDDGCKIWLLNGCRILEKEKKSSKKMLLNDYRGYKTIDTFEMFPSQAAISGNGLIGYASAPDPDGKMFDLYKYARGVRTPQDKPLWQFWGKIIGLSTNYDGDKVIVVTADKKVQYRDKSGNFILLREFAGVPNGAVLTGDGKTALITVDHTTVVKYAYDDGNDTYKNSGTVYTAKPLDIVIGVASDANAGKIWIMTRHEDGGYTKLRQGSFGDDFSKIIYTFDPSNEPWSVTLSGDGNVGYVALSFSWIYRFVWDPSRSSCFVDRIHY